VSAATRWLQGPRFVIPGISGPPVHALEIDATGAICGWAERVPAGCSATTLPGRHAIAGLHDAHLHLDWLGALGDELDLGGVTQLPELRSRVSAWSQSRPQDPVLVARDLNLEALDGLEGGLHWRALEGLSDRPIVIRGRDGHALWLDRRAMDAVPAAWPVSDPTGGRIERDGDGAPTGVLVDSAAEPAQALFAFPSPDLLRRRLGAALERCAQAGLSSVHSMALPPQAVDLLAALDADGGLPLRVFAYLDGTQAESWERLGAGEPLTPRLQLSGIKLFADGALGSRGAAMLEGYTDEPACCGHLRYPPDELARLVTRAHLQGFQVAIHAIGDQGNRVALDALTGLPGVAQARHRIEHAQIVEPSDRDRFASLGVVASMQPCHATSDAPWVEERLGPARMGHAYPWTALASAGVTLAFGTDAPIEALEPGPAMASAMDRAVVGPAMAGAAVLEARTHGAAVACRADRWLGRLAPGQRADLTLFDTLPDTAAGWRALHIVGRVLDGSLMDSA
jgi:predicted amidohydrolase YtcJ